MKSPPLPCEMTTSGSLSPSIEQSFTPGRVVLPTTTSCGGIAQGDQTAPFNAGPSKSAGTSINPKPAASAAVAARHMRATRKSLSACMGAELLIPIWLTPPVFVDDLGKWYPAHWPEATYRITDRQ